MATYSFVCAKDIIGRYEDETAIIGMSLDSETQQNSSVIPIVGIGGLGKAALSQIVYSSELVQKHLEVRLWARISEDFDVKLIVRNVVRSIANTNVDGNEFDELFQRIRGAVEAKRYILVLDDIWNGLKVQIVNVGDSDARCLQGGTRYVNFTNVKSTWTIPPPLLGAKHLRLLRRQYLNFSSDCRTFFTRFKFLRMLDLHKAGVSRKVASCQVPLVS
ncbi:unnamed protein product [Dovyalis caffra]|uniref:NB-ARC domain-containing protein n=1 Tax=Dovyalis caffra TaxID=77055 RepID=A0AAV1QRV9_9ROSI|nr:unnamed protein product [Dovyalis caffra]